MSETIPIANMRRVSMEHSLRKKIEHWRDLTLAETNIDRKREMETEMRKYALEYKRLTGDWYRRDW